MNYLEGNSFSSFLESIILSLIVLLFNRFRSDLFLKWNRSEEQLHFLLDKPMIMDKQHQSVQLKSTIGTRFNFLDVEISHHDGQLHTRIYCDLVIDQYELPNNFGDDVDNLPSYLLQAILAYAVRCCSTEQSFHYERRYMKLIYLLYGFSIDFSDNCIQQFYKQFQASEVHYLIDRIPYEALRKRVCKRREELIDLKQHSHTEIEKIRSISYSKQDSSSSTMMTYFKRQLVELLTKCFIFEPEFHEDEIELQSHFIDHCPSTIKSHLEKQKPLGHLLVLLDKESDSCDSMY